jgi:type II secretory pathway pseudopilin PulG
MIRRSQKPRPSEEGYMLVAIIFMLAILILSMAVAIPRVRDNIRRDREVETMQRGKQYIRAVQLYYRKFGAYPPNIDALVKTNNIRFLRKKYVDPTTGKDEWKPVLFGQNKTPQAMGFFGQPLAASSLAGTGPGGGNAMPGAIGAGGAGVASPTGGGLFNSTPTSGSSTDAGTTSTPTTGTPPGTTGGTDANGNPASGTGTSGTPSAGGTSATGGTTTTGTTGTGTTGTGTTGSGSGGQTFGGGGIIGFTPQSPRQSILVYKKKNHYNEWEFLYSPLMDQQTMSGGNTGTVGQPAGSATTPIGGTTPTTPTPPATPATPAPQQ